MSMEIEDNLSMDPTASQCLNTECGCRFIVCYFNRARRVISMLHGARLRVTSLDGTGIGLQSIDLATCRVYTMVYTCGGSYGNRETI
jgi:hypothetical protein